MGLCNCLNLFSTIQVTLHDLWGWGIKGNTASTWLSLRMVPEEPCLTSRMLAPLESLCWKGPVKGSHRD